MSQPTTAVSAKAEDVTSGDEFIVHLKHTCDACHIRPIVGKRFTSSDLRDYDLCSKCFEGRGEKKGGFEEVLLARDKPTKNMFHLKLKIQTGGNGVLGEAQTRRINVSDLWDPSASQLSYDKMMAIAASYADAIESTYKFDPIKATVTYIDEDGDRINISSNEELMDAFIQTVKKSPPRPFRVTAISIEKKAEVKPRGPPAHWQPHAHPRYCRRGLGPRDGLKSSKWEVVGVKGKPDEKIDFASTPFFIHARHTCDGCSKTPIIGTRYHATKVPDYDLCSACFEAYTGEDLGFEPEFLARDTPMQGKWFRKQFKKCMFMNKDEMRELFERNRCVSPKPEGLDSPKSTSTEEKEDEKKGGVASGEGDKKFADKDADGVANLAGRGVAAEGDEPVNKGAGDVSGRNEGSGVPADVAGVRGVELVHASAPCKPFIKPTIAQLSPVSVCSSTNSNIEPNAETAPPAKETDKKPVPEEAETGKPVVNETTEEPSPENPPSPPLFIHARHTCDGCSKTPIIGTRYSATKIPDFDLCEACFKTYEGEDLDFKTETLDIDRRMQPRWLRKHAMVTKGLAQLIGHIVDGSAKAAAASKAADSRSSEATTAEKKDDSKLEEKSEVVKDADVQVEVAESKESTRSVDEKSDEKSAIADQSASKPVEKESDSAEAPHSPGSKATNESFLSDAEGHGSIAEVIGRTLDVCVQKMEEEMEQIENIDKKDIAAIVDTYSVASSVFSSVTDILKKMDDSKSFDKSTVAGMPTDVPSLISGATILKSVADTQDQEDNNIGDVHVEDASVESDGWSVVDSDSKDDKDEFAGAAEMIGSSLYNSGVISCVERGETKEECLETGSSGSEPLSPIVLAKWDTELKQLAELGFTDERKNVDVLERLEASHVGCDSTDKVTVNSAVDMLLEGK